MTHVVHVTMSALHAQQRNPRESNGFVALMCNVTFKGQIVRPAFCQGGHHISCFTCSKRVQEVFASLDTLVGQEVAFTGWCSAGRRIETSAIRIANQQLTSVVSNMLQQYAMYIKPFRTTHGCERLHLCL